MMASSPARAEQIRDDFEIRRGSPADLDDLERIEHRSFVKDRFPRRNLTRLLKSAATLFLVAEREGAPAGYAMLLFRKGASVARLYSIAVDPAFRGKGVAEALLTKAQSAAAARGARRLRLEFRPSNSAAQRLYERAGFTLFERKAGYYGDGEDAIRMERRLSDNTDGRSRP